MFDYRLEYVVSVDDLFDGWVDDAHARFDAYRSAQRLADILQYRLCDALPEADVMVRVRESSGHDAIRVHVDDVRDEERICEIARTVAERVYSDSDNWVREVAP